MTKREFLDELWSALLGGVSESEAREKIEYYENYFKSEEQKGRSSDDIIAELGDPKLIAKTIIDTSTSREETLGDDYTSVIYEDSSNRGRTYRESSNNGPFSSYYYMGPGCGGTSGCLILVLVFYLIMVLAGYLLRGAVDLTLLLFSSPLAVIVLIILIVYWMSKRK